MRPGHKAVAEIFRRPFDLFQFIGADGIPQRTDASFCLFSAGSRFQFSDDVQPARAAIIEIFSSRYDFGLHRHRDKNIWRVAHHHAVKAGRRNSDDTEKMTVHQDALVQDSRIRAETALPITETQHDNGVRIGHEIVRGNE